MKEHKSLLVSIFLELIYFSGKPRTNTINTARTNMQAFSLLAGTKFSSTCSYNLHSGISHERQREETKNRFNFKSIYPLGHKIHTEISQSWDHQSEVEYRNKHSVAIFIIVDIELFSICDTILQEEHIILGNCFCSYQKLYSGELICTLQLFIVYYFPSLLNQVTHNKYVPVPKYREYKFAPNWDGSHLLTHHTRVLGSWVFRNSPRLISYNKCKWACRKLPRVNLVSELVGKPSDNIT